MYEIIKEANGNVATALEGMKKTLLDCVKKMGEPNQSKTVRAQTVKASTRQIKGIANDAINEIQRAAIVSVFLARGAEKMSPTTCQKWLEEWQTDEAEVPKGGD